MLKANFHTHTILCDGSDEPEQVVTQALAYGFTQLGFSGHMDPDIRMNFPQYKAEVLRLREKYRDRIDILLGVELDTLYADPSCAMEAEYVIGSTHFIDLPTTENLSVDFSEEMLEKTAKEFFSGDYYALAKAYYETEAKVCDRFRPTFIGHFDLVTRFNDAMHFLDESDPRYIGPAMETLEYLAREKNVPFEINCGAVNRGRKKEFYPNHFFLKALRDFGGEIFISSDAHQKELLNGAFEEAVREAIACGFTHTNILKHDGNGNVVTEQIPLDTLY